MITSKSDLRFYLEKDKQALGRRRRWPSPFDDIWIFEIALRHHEYYKNVNPGGKWCDVHACVNIGEGLDRKAPQIGDNCWIGPGAKLFGGITVGKGVMIGAGSVVNKSFGDYVRIAGVPAKIIKHEGEPYHRE